MNLSLHEINEIIALCDEMVKYASRNGTISSGNEIYIKYASSIYTFMYTHSLMDKNYPIFCILDQYHTSSRGATLNLREVKTIYEAVVALKHDLFPECFEKIFISHREKDQKQIVAFMELLYAIGIPRPSAAQSERVIFCTSHPAAYLENGSRNLAEIRKQFTDQAHTFYILWYTDNYFESQACLNEAGAIWAMEKKYQEILSPNFKSEKIGGLLDKEQVWFRADNKYRLNLFKEQIERMFGLTPISQNAWETARDAFIHQINKILEEEQENRNG